MLSQTQPEWPREWCELEAETDKRCPSQVACLISDKSMSSIAREAAVANGGCYFLCQPCKHRWTSRPVNHLGWSPLRCICQCEDVGLDISLCFCNLVNLSVSSLAVILAQTPDLKPCCFISPHRFQLSSLIKRTVRSLLLASRNEHAVRPLHFAFARVYVGRVRVRGLKRTCQIRRYAIETTLELNNQLYIEMTSPEIEAESRGNKSKLISSLRLRRDHIRSKAEVPKADRQQ